MKEEPANAEVEHDRSADAPRPQRAEVAQGVEEVQSPIPQPRAAHGGWSAVRRRWKWILVAFCAAVALVFALPKLRDQQPRYQGRTVEGWLAQMKYSKRGPNGIDPLAALRAMGRDAVPYEIKVLGLHDSMWRRMLRKVLAKAPSWVAETLPNSADLVDLRGAALMALLDNPRTGDFALQIVPLLEDSDPWVRLLAAHVVSHVAKRLDDSAIPTLRRAVNDPHPTIRSLVLQTLGSMNTALADIVLEMERAIKSPTLMAIFLRAPGCEPAARTLWTDHGINL